MEISDHFFSSNGVKLYFAETGIKNGQIIILLHGYPESSETWRYLLPGLRDTYRIIMPDMRGYGKSDKPTGTASYDKFSMAEDLHNLTIHLGINKFILVGHDRGARTARAFALHYPEQLIGLCFIDIVPMEWIYDSMTAADVSKKYWHWIWNLVPGQAEMLLKGHEQEFLESKFNKSPGLLEKLKREGTFGHYLDAFVSGGLEAELNDYRETYRVDLPHYRELRDKQIKIEIPILLLWGETGNLEGLPVMEIWEKFASDISGTEIKGCGHFVQEEKAEQVLKTLLEFIRTR